MELQETVVMPMKRSLQLTVLLEQPEVVFPMMIVLSVLLLSIVYV